MVLLQVYAFCVGVKVQDIRGAETDGSAGPSMDYAL
jgi:hypothetical protein